MPTCTKCGFPATEDDDNNVLCELHRAEMDLYEMVFILGEELAAMSEKLHQLRRRLDTKLRLIERLHTQRQKESQSPAHPIAQ